MIHDRSSTKMVSIKNKHTNQNPKQSKHFETDIIKLTLKLSPGK